MTTAALRNLRRVSAPTLAVSHRGVVPLLHRAVAGACMFLFVMQSPASAQTPDVADRSTADDQAISIEQEVLNNILRQPLGETTVESLNLPQPFLRRVAGRIIRSSYQHRYHVVVAAESSSQTTPNGASTTMEHDPASSVSSKQKHDDQAMASSKTWLYLIGLGTLIGTAAGALALRRSRRAQQ